MKNFRFSNTIILIILTCINLSSQENLSQQIREHIEKGLKFMEINQIDETIEGIRYAGEWPNDMCLQRGFVLLGKKKCHEDSNCFSVTSIHNELAQIFLLYPEFDQIPEMLDKSFARIVTYKNGQVFNFWNLLPPNRNLKKSNEPDPQPLVRRPTNYPLKSQYINNAANVVEDADDTAHAYAAMALRKKILALTLLDETHHFDTDSLGIILDQYRDLNRINRHYFNYLTGNDHDTGAFLTWLGEEFQIKKWNPFIEVSHNAVFYLPISKCYPHPYKSYIPYGANNIDAIVNSNILSALAINNVGAEGKQSALEFLEKKSKKRKYRKVGSYYPNSYHFPYALSNAYANGNTELEESAKNICVNLLKSQKKDGSWHSKRKLNKKDKVQSTAYAINALINFGQFEKRKTDLAIEKGITYLLSQSIKDKEGLHWKGGVFFSGGTVVRNNLIWKSDAFTTVNILKAFTQYLSYLETDSEKI